MMRFFRKYNKQMLAVIMALLMIVFIGGSALEGLLRPDPNFEIAKSNLGPISSEDQRVATAETRLLESMGQDWHRPLFSSGDPIETVDWVLLLREAEKLGVRVDEDSVKSSPGIESQMDSIRIVAHNLRVKPSAVIAAMAKLQTIRQAASRIASASAVSEAEVISIARDALERVKIRAVVLPAEAFEDASATPSEAQIKEQFEKYREREAGPGLQFGYHQKPAIKVQYIKIDRDAIAGKIKIPNEERKAKAYYEEHREKDPAFRRKPEELAVHDPEVGPPAPKPTVYVDWERARDTAITKLHKDYADENVQRIVDWIVPTAGEAWMGIAPAESGYKPAPKEVADLEYYKRLIERLPQGLNHPDTVTVHTTDFFTEEEAAKVPELGPLSVRAGQSLVSKGFGAIAFANEFVVPKIPEGSKVNAGDFLASFQTAPFPLTDSKTGNVYVFRVVDYKPGGAPESIEQVRDKVIADLKLQQGYEAAKKRAESLASCCRAGEALKEAYEADPELATFRETGEGAKTGFFEPPAFSRVGPAPAWKGRPADGVFVGGGLGKLPNETVDAIFAMEDAPEKLAVMELPDRASVMVVEWIETTAPAEVEFAEQRKMMETQLADARWRDFVNDWFDPEKIRARNGFKLTTNR